MPDFLPVGLQDFLYSRKSELRKGEIGVRRRLSEAYKLENRITNISSGEGRCLLCVYAKWKDKTKWYINIKITVIILSLM